MNTYYCRKNNNSDSRWMISLGGFSADKRNAVIMLAKSRRQSVSSFVASLLDAEIQKEGQKENVK